MRPFPQLNQFGVVGQRPDTPPARMSRGVAAHAILAELVEALAHTSLAGCAEAGLADIDNSRTRHPQRSQLRHGEVGRRP